MLSQYDRIVITDGVRSGQARIKGTRITVSDILGWLATGMTFAEITVDFSELSEADIMQALAYAADRERRTHIVAA